MALLNAAPQEINVKLYYREKKMPAGFTKIIVIPNEEAEKTLKKAADAKEAKDKETDVQCLNTYWKILNWDMQNKITEQSAFFNESTQMPDINVWKYRDLRIRQCLVRWDLIDDQHVAVPVNDTAISMLPGEVVLALLEKYDEAVTLRPEDRKN